MHCPSCLTLKIEKLGLTSMNGSYAALLFDPSSADAGGRNNDDETQRIIEQLAGVASNGEGEAENYASALLRERNIDDDIERKMKEFTDVPFDASGVEGGAVNYASALSTNPNPEQDVQHLMEFQRTAEKRSKKINKDMEELLEILDEEEREEKRRLDSFNKLFKQKREIELSREKLLDEKKRLYAQISKNFTENQKKLKQLEDVEEEIADLKKKFKNYH